MDEAYYVGFNVNGQDIGLDPHGHSNGMTTLSATGTPPLPSDLARFGASERLLAGSQSGSSQSG